MLTPISRDEARRRETFNGQTLPATLPTVRRVKPAPYRRERIDISRHGRAWQPCRAEDVQAGDVVPGVGKVASRELVTRYEAISGYYDVAVGMKLILTNIAGERFSFEPGAQLRAFRLAG